MTVPIKILRPISFKSFEVTLNFSLKKKEMVQLEEFETSLSETENWFVGEQKIDAKLFPKELFRSFKF